MVVIHKVTASALPHLPLCRLYVIGNRSMVWSRAHHQSTGVSGWVAGFTQRGGVGVGLAPPSSLVHHSSPFSGTDPLKPRDSANEKKKKMMMRLY